MTWIGTWLVLLVGQDPSGIADAITNAPEGQTQAEKILIWIAVIQFLLLVGSNIAQWIMNQRIHRGHKEQIREQERAFTEACREIQRDERSRREEMTRNLVALIERVATSEKDFAVAMQSLADKQ